MSDNIEELISGNLEVWTSAIERKSGAGRGNGKRIGLYGIERLRALILDLAIRGKLVAQDPGAPAGAALLEQIETKKRELFKSRAAKRLALVEPPASWPFSLPGGWVWSQIGTITNYGETEKANPGEVSDDTWVLELEDVEKGSSRLLERVRHSSRKFQSQKNRFRPGDVIYGKLRPYLDKVLVADEEGVCTTEMVPIRGYLGLEPAYLRLFLKAPYFIELADSSTHGMNLPRLGTDKARAAPIALPPVAEQQRIVAKVNELMALCDTLEEKCASALEAHQMLVETLLATLVNANEAADLTRQWTRLEDHFDSLFTTEASIEALKQTILELAVRGRLVDRDDGGETGQKLLETVFSEPWAKARQSAKLRPDRQALANASPIPENWAWATVEALTRPNQTVTYGILKPVWVADGVPTVRVTEMKTGIIDVRDLPQCDRSRADKFRKTTLRAGDLLISKDGTIGKTAFVPPELEGGNITQHVLRFPITDLVDRHFVRLVIDAPSSQAWMAGETKGVALQGVNVGDFRRMPIPLPPLAEQQRIVVKVDELMALCDALRAALSGAAQTQKHLADAIVERAAA